jgi:hypothetical protein
MTHTENTIKVAADFFIRTNLCTEGFTGDGCSRCAKDYYVDGFNCRACKNAAVEGSSLAIGIAASFCSVLGVLLVSLPARQLVRVVTAVLGMQKISLVLFAATPYIDTPAGLVKALEVLGMLFGVFNIELSILKPGCELAGVSFISELYGTLLFAMAVALAYICLCAFRGAFIVPARRCAGLMDTFSEKHVSKKPSKSQARSLSSSAKVPSRSTIHFFHFARSHA